MMFNIHTLRWDKEILDWFDIPQAILPKPCSNSEIVGHTDPKIFHGEEIPIASVIVDQQGALFGQACYEPSMVKNTYGTGCFILMNTGEHPTVSQHGLLTTIAWYLDGKVTYALDGGIFITGAAVQWLRDGLKIIKDVAQTEEMAMNVKDTKGVYFVPAFVGMAAPYWDMYARGTILGITGGTTREHIARATLEAIAYQVYDVLECMKVDSKYPIEKLRVDGGAVANKFLMQFQADILGIPVEVPRITETTALGAAYLAGLAVNFWESQEELSRIWQIDQVYKPQMSREKREQLLDGWKRAVQRSLNWEKREEGLIW
jgi:glycerol kinase